MLYTTLQDALNALSSTPATTDALMSLVQQASIDATGAITIFYSGNVGDVNAGSIVNSMLNSGADIRVIDKSVAGELLSSDAFRSKVAEAFGITELKGSVTKGVSMS